MMSAREEHDQKMKRLAWQAFEKHEIREASERHWWIQRKEEGRWCSEFHTEILCLSYSAQIFVGGDISPIVFAYGPNDVHARLMWMGKVRPDISYYVAQKARIGSGHPLRSWDEGVARGDILELLKEDWVKEWEEDEDGRDEGVGELIEYLRHTVEWGVPWSSDVFWENAPNGLAIEYFGDHIGLVVDPAVYYAQAAVSRLCILLDLIPDPQRDRTPEADSPGPRTQPSTEAGAP